MSAPTKAGMEFIMWCHTINDVATDSHRNLLGLKRSCSLCLFYCSSTGPTVPKLDIHYVLYSPYSDHWDLLSFSHCRCPVLQDFHEFAPLSFQSVLTKASHHFPAVPSCAQEAIAYHFYHSTGSRKFFLSRLVFFSFNSIFFQFVWFGFICFGVGFFVLLVCFSGGGCLVFGFFFVFLPVCIISLGLSKGLIV